MSSSEGGPYELFIRPLPLDSSDHTLNAALNDVFGRFGTIIHTKIRRDSIHAFAFVQFASKFAALQAIYEVSGSLVFGKKLSLTWSGHSIKSFRTRYDVRVEQHPWKLDKPRIIELFARYGPTVVENESRNTKGFTHVRFSHAEAAQQAIDELDGIDIEGVEASVCWAPASSPPGTELFVRFVPVSVSLRTMRKLFGEYGRLTEVRIVRDRTRAKNVANAYVRFLDESDAERAMVALDGYAMSRGPIRITWTRASRPAGHIVRVLDLPVGADMKTLTKIFSRYGGAAVSHFGRVEVDYDGSGNSNQMAFLTFTNREQAQNAVKEFDGSFRSDGEGIIRTPADRLNREFEGIAAARTASASGAIDSASTRAVIPDLLTDSVLRGTTSAEKADAPVDLIDLSDPSLALIPSADVSPVEVGHIYAEKREYEIPMRFYSVPESEKLAMATQILVAGVDAEQDLNNNASDERNTKVTLVARSTPELVATMGRINAAGMDCWISFIRGGHSFHPSALMTVNVTTAPVCGKIKYSQHVVFLSPIDDPEDMGAAMEAMMLQRTQVNLVSVLFDESDGDQRLQVSELLNLLR